MAVTGSRAHDTTGRWYELTQEDRDKQPGHREPGQVTTSREFCLVALQNCAGVRGIVMGDLVVFAR